MVHLLYIWQTEVGALHDLNIGFVQTDIGGILTSAARVGLSHSHLSIVYRSSLAGVHF